MLRDFQQDLETQTYQAWHEGAIAVMQTMATGGGKTKLFCHIAQKFNAPVVAIAHRQELVSQAALAFNRERVPHSIIAQQKVLHQIIALQHDTHGYSCFSSRAPIRVAGVDSLKNYDKNDRWLSQVALGIIDEGHHVLRDNKWGRAVGMFPNSRWLFPTAHAVRADRKGLGRTASGYVDRLLLGPYGRQLINRGFLTDYRIVCAKADVDFDSLQPGPSGELNQVTLRAVTHSSKVIVGNAVKLYQQYGPGKLGVTFVVDKEEAVKTRNEFQAGGVPCEIITDETPVGVRSQLMRKFAARQILMLVSVDCLGEGVDVPAIEIVILARRTASWQLMCQQIGRGLRVMVPTQYEANWNTFSDVERLAIIANSVKPKAIIIDLVGNIIWHAQFRGLFDSKQEYSLSDGERNARKSDAIPLRTCLECKQPYEQYLLKCPYCLNIPVPTQRSTPELVDGDIIELDPAVLRALRGEADRVMGPCFTPADVSASVKSAIMRKHHDRYAAQTSLRFTMMIWGGWQKHLGLQDREAQKLFFIRYGIDVLSAQGLGTTEAIALDTRIKMDLERANVQAA